MTDLSLDLMESYRIDFLPGTIILRKDVPGQYLIKSYFFLAPCKRGVYRPSHPPGDKFMQRDEHAQYPEREQLGDDRKVMQQDERAGGVAYAKSHRRRRSAQQTDVTGFPELVRTLRRFRWIRWGLGRQRNQVNKSEAGERGRKW
jgi:hypothetical protein